MEWSEELERVFTDTQTVRQLDSQTRIGELENWSRRALKQKSRWVTRYYYSAVPILPNGIASLYLGRWYVYVCKLVRGWFFAPSSRMCLFGCVSCRKRCSVASALSSCIPNSNSVLQCIYGLHFACICVCLAVPSILKNHLLFLANPTQKRETCPFLHN